ncbi:MAG TPA: hypothetical protein VLA43_00380, partial [Longimicrobiales bacterium]|nr:hypothetical protein [Longimicrobiales bacterium]
LNLALGWLWLVLGTVAGLVLGSFFHREGWLGGYGSLERRMYRLMHISFFGLGFLNLLFHFTVRTLPAPGEVLAVASWALALGAVTMPVCCGLMARRPRFRLLFAVPVAGVLVGTVITLREVWPS